MAKIADQLSSGFKLFLFFLLLVVSILALYLRLLVTPKNRKQEVKFRARKTFCRRTNSIFGLHLSVVGHIPSDECYLYVSNHRSFYDPVAFLSCLNANPVSKAEVSRYPLIGWGARLTEVLMLDRNAKEERRRMKHRIYENLRDGTSILIYPEGTTSALPLTDTFRKGAFESAVKAGRAVIPVAMEYPDSSYYWINRPLYDQFVYQVVYRADRRIYLSIGQPITNPDPLILLEKTQNSINLQIAELRKIRQGPVKR